MTIWVRNLEVPPVTAAGGSALLIAVRELLRVARWTEQSNDGDPDWPDPGSPNWVVGPTDLQVDPAYPRRITSAGSAPFTSAMIGDMIALLATNDQNRSMWRITAFIDSNNIEVDDQGFTPFNWVLESGITGRVVKVASALSVGSAQSLWNAPSGNMQARMFYAAADAPTFYVRPKGQVPLATECTGVSYGEDADYKHRMHMVAQDEIVILYWSTEDQPLRFLMWGSLLDTDAADTDPNFILKGYNSISLVEYEMYMLDGADASIRVYPTAPKKYWTQQITSANFFNYFNSRQANNGKAVLRSPWVVLANVSTVGASVRGRIPLIAQTHEGYERLRPLDAAGTWLHIYDGVGVPRNGPDDKLPLIPV